MAIYSKSNEKTVRKDLKDVFDEWEEEISKEET